MEIFDILLLLSTVLSFIKRGDLDKKLQKKFIVIIKDPLRMVEEGVVEMVLHISEKQPDCTYVSRIIIVTISFGDGNEKHLIFIKFFIEAMNPDTRRSQMVLNRTYQCCPKADFVIMAIADFVNKRRWMDVRYPMTNRGESFTG